MTVPLCPSLSPNGELTRLCRPVPADVLCLIIRLCGNDAVELWMVLWPGQYDNLGLQNDTCAICGWYMDWWPGPGLTYPGLRPLHRHAARWPRNVCSTGCSRFARHREMQRHERLEASGMQAHDAPAE